MSQFASYEMIPFSMGHASIPCDGVDDYLINDTWFDGNLDFLETFSNDTETLLSADDSSTCEETIDLPSVDGNSTAEDTNSYSAPVDAVNEEEEGNDEAIYGIMNEMFADCPVVAYDNLDAMNSHFYGNLNVLKLPDDLIKRIRIFHDCSILPIQTIGELKQLFENVCMIKSELAAKLAAIESESAGISTIDAEQLKREMMGDQTAQSRALLLALFANSAVSILLRDDPFNLHEYFSELNCSPKITALSGGVPDVKEVAFLTKCMGTMNVIHHELQLDCSKGMLITAAVMLAHPTRTYSNGGRQAKSVKVLEGLFHSITGVDQKPRTQNSSSVSPPKTVSRKRKSDEMSSDSL